MSKSVIWWRLLGGVVCAALLAAPALAGGPLAAWLPGNSTGAEAAASFAGKVITTPLSRSGVDFNSGGTFNSRSWETGSTANSGKYLEWGVAPDIGFQLDLTSLAIRYDRSPSGPAQLEIRFSTDNFATVDTLVFSDAAVSDAGEENGAIDLSGLPTLSYGETGLFRLYGFDAASSAGTFDIEDTTSFDGANGLVIYGAVLRVPIGGRSRFIADEPGLRWFGPGVAGGLLLAGSTALASMAALLRRRGG